MADALACPACGTPTVPGARFCFNCGAALDAKDDPRAERRVVTVLFGDLSDFTAWAEDLDPERVKEVTDRVLAALAQAVHDYGGHVDKLTGDGIMAVFGAPTAHEDDPERAVRAAARMQSEVRKLVVEEVGGGRQLGLRVGLNTGPVLAGVQAAMSYTVVGDTVNTASRLSDVAGVGAVLAGRETVLSTLNVGSWRALPPMRLKGKREPVQAYELVALRPRSAARLGLGDEAPLVGREGELGLLISRLLDAVDRRQPTSMLVAGDAGLGKTRLARELSRFAAELPHSRVLWGRCTPYGEGGDLAPLVEMVRTACGIEEADDDAVARERVRRTITRLEHPTFGAWAQGMFVDRLLALLGLGGGDEESIVPRPATPGDTGDPGDDVLAAIAGLFRALAHQGPLVLVVDDVHWATDELLDTVAGLAGEVGGRPVLVLALSRQDDVAGRLPKWLAKLPDASRLDLDPLEEAATERLLRAYLGGSDVDEASRAALLDRAQGNPFFLAELLHLLVDRGLLRREGAAWRLDGELPPDVLPAGVQALLTARIDGLDGGAKTALRDAAVVGSTFWPDALATLRGTSREEVARRLALLVERGIVHPGDAGAYSFAHMLTREVAYAAIPKADRARAHAAVARWAAGGLPALPPDVDGFVAAHAERATVLANEMNLPASDPARSAAALAFASLVRLGTTALSRDENRVAADHLGRALALGDDIGTPDERQAARLAHAQALAALHQLDAATGELTSALDAEDPRLRARAFAILGEIRRKQGDDDGALASFVRSLHASSEAGDDRIAGEAMRQLGLLDYFGGRLRDAERRFEEALRLARRVNDQRGVGWALQHLAWSATTRGDYDLADRTLEEAVGVFASFGDTGGIAWSAGTEAFVRLFQGRLADARGLARDLLPNAAETKDQWGQGACLTIDSMSSAELGDLTYASERAHEADRMYGGINDTWGRTLAIVAAGSAARGLGQRDEAIQYLRLAVELSGKAGHPSTQILALIALGWTQHDARDFVAAEQAAHQALALAQQMGLEPHAEIGSRVLVALARRARGDHASALAVLADIAASPEQPTLLFPMRQALAHYAGTLLDAGQRELALDMAERATRTPGEDVRSEVLSLRAYGNALAANGRREEAVTVLRQALAAATRTEFRLEAATTEKALAEVAAASVPAVPAPAPAPEG